MKWKAFFWPVLSFLLAACIMLISCNGSKTNGASDTSVSKRKSDTSKHAIVAQPKKVEITDKELPFSEPIKKADAKALRMFYEKRGNYLNTIGSLNLPVKLKKFRFNVSDINEILARLDVTPKKTVDKVVLKFGLDINKPKRWHLIAYAMQAGTLLEMPDPKTTKFTNFYNFDYKAASLTTRLSNLDASKSRMLYEKNNLLVTIDKNNVAIDTLYGFAFNADQIWEIVNNNASGDKPDEVVFYLGKEPVTLGQRWHIIAYGRKIKLLDYSNTTTSSGAAPAAARAASIFDKADPCPPCK